MLSQSDRVPDRSQTNYVWGAQIIGFWWISSDYVQILGATELVAQQYSMIKLLTSGR